MDVQNLDRHWRIHNILTGFAGPKALLSSFGIQFILLNQAKNNFKGVLAEINKNCVEVINVGYFSELVLEDHELNLMRTIMSYPERLDTLQVYRDSLVAMLPTVGNYLADNQPEDRFLQ